LGYRQQLSVVDDDIQRGIANIDSVLVEEELLLISIQRVLQASMQLMV